MNTPFTDEVTLSSEGFLLESSHSMSSSERLWKDWLYPLLSVGPTSKDTVPSGNQGRSRSLCRGVFPVQARWKEGSGSVCSPHLPCPSLLRVLLS